MLSELFCCEVPIEKPVLVFLNNITVNKGLSSSPSLVAISNKPCALLYCLTSEKEFCFKITKNYMCQIQLMTVSWKRADLVCDGNLLGS